MKFTKKYEPTMKPIGSLYLGSLFLKSISPEEDIYMLLATNGFEGVNLSTGEVEKFDVFLEVIPVEGELVWNYCAE